MTSAPCNIFDTVNVDKMDQFFERVRCENWSDKFFFFKKKNLLSSIHPCAIPASTWCASKGVLKSAARLMRSWVWQARDLTGLSRRTRGIYK